MSEYDAIIDAGRQLGDPKEVPGGRHYTVIKSTNNADQVVDLEYLLDEPSRTRGKVTAQEVATFNAYVNEYKCPNTKLFANRTSFEVHAIIDYHEPEQPHWGGHRIVYTAPRSTEWMIWQGANGKSMEQTPFAQFIEDNLIDIRDPPGAQVLDVTRNLQAKKAVEFSSAIHAASGGIEFSYTETIQGSSQRGRLTVPEQFTLGIPVFQGDEPYAVLARLRYRIDAGKVRFWYDLVRPDAMERDAFDKIISTIDTATGITVWHGIPPS